MAIRKIISSKRKIDNSGFTTSAGKKSARFINKDGTANVHFKGLTFLDSINVYQYLINVSNLTFIIWVMAFYTVINCFFALIYYLFCLDNLSGLIKGSALENFEEAYFFSSQTLTTVGYGRVSPVGLFTNTVASLEALIGILTLAIITGLLYGRFVKPRAYIRFSQNALIAPFKGGKALMFRIAPFKNARLAEVNVSVTCSMLVEEDGKLNPRYFQLPLQFDNINSLYISWTVVHPIDEESPLYNLSAIELAEADCEIMIFIKAFDEDFSNTVMARSSYTANEIIEGAKFVPIFSDELHGTVVEPSKLNKYEMVQAH